MAHPFSCVVAAGQAKERRGASVTGAARSRPSGGRVEAAGSREFVGAKGCRTGGGMHSSRGAQPAPAALCRRLARGTVVCRSVRTERLRQEQAVWLGWLFAPRLASGTSRCQEASCRNTCRWAALQGLSNEHALLSHLGHPAPGAGCRQLVQPRVLCGTVHAV